MWLHQFAPSILNLKKSGNKVYFNSNALPMESKITNETTKKMNHMGSIAKKKAKTWVQMGQKVGLWFRSALWKSEAFHQRKLFENIHGYQGLTTPQMQTTKKTSQNGMAIETITNQYQLHKKLCWMRQVCPINTHCERNISRQTCDMTVPYAKEWNWVFACEWCSGRHKRKTWWREL